MYWNFLFFGRVPSFCSQLPSYWWSLRPFSPKSPVKSSLWAPGLLDVSGPPSVTAPCAYREAASLCGCWEFAQSLSSDGLLKPQPMDIYIYIYIFYWLQWDTWLRNLATPMAIYIESHNHLANPMFQNHFWGCHPAANSHGSTQASDMSSKIVFWRFSTRNFHDFPEESGHVPTCRAEWPVCMSWIGGGRGGLFVLKRLKGER